MNPLSAARTASVWLAQPGFERGGGIGPACLASKPARVAPETPLISGAPAWKRALLAVALCALAGCERGVHNMYEQPKYLPLAPSALFNDGNSARPQVADTVVHADGVLADASSGRNGAVTPLPPPGPALGVDALGKPLAQTGVALTPVYANPLPITPQRLARGRERYDIYCAPCHSIAGDGEGLIVQRGFPAPPTYHSERLRRAADSHFYQVISEGYGAMYPYADRITPEDRWAIVAYIRALQLSRHAPAASLTPADRALLQRGAP